MSESTEEVRGTAVIIRFTASRCIHSRQCVLGRPDVFVPNVAGEWIHPDRATVAEVAELAHACPSGAITYARLDGGPDEAPPRVNTIRVRANGPLALHAPLTVGGEPAGFRATLCRCGASRRKPWCDGSHTAAGFQATGEPPVGPLATLAERGGALAVEPLPDGPLRITGPAELVSGTGRTVGRAGELFLCRCGASRNKPWCDGSHTAAGFRAP